MKRGAKVRRAKAVDLFCGAGGTSGGYVNACGDLGVEPELTAINHWPVAIETHSMNHRTAKHLCVAVDHVNPRDVVPGGKLDLLIASPECTHHSRARGSTPVTDQKRASGWLVLRWLEQLDVRALLVENVPEYLEWGPIGSNGKPLKSRKGETFRAWVAAIESLGYRVEWKILCAADYGDPTTRERLFVLARKGRAPIEWPAMTHGKVTHTLFGELKRWRTARNSVIDWSLEGRSIFGRKKPLSPKTMKRIEEGLRRFCGKTLEPFLIHMEHGGRVRNIDRPIPTVTTAKGGALALVEPFLLSQASGGAPRSVDEPVPTICADGAVGLVSPFLTKYYGTATASSVDAPLDTVTTKARFGLCEPIIVRNEAGDLMLLDIRFRMLQPHELAAAMSFPSGYRFAGTKQDVTKQIGNAVPGELARALCRAQLAPTFARAADRKRRSAAA